MSVLPDRVLPVKPFQFSLRTLFIGVALLGMLLAILAYLEPIWSLALIWSMLLIAAHVAGNFWGTRSSASQPSLPATDDPLCAGAKTTIRFAPATRLRDSSRLTPWMLATAVVCATLGAVGGTTTVIYLYHNAVSYLGTIIASISGATLGALLGFLASSFVSIGGRAFREAAHDPSLPPARR